MEFGFCSHGNFVYMSDARSGSADELSVLYERINEWVQKHGVILGEGIVDLRLGSALESEGIIGYYDMRAPIIEGPEMLLEQIP